MAAPTRRELLSAREGVARGRRLRQGASSALSTALVLLALVLVLALSIRFRTTWDLSRHGANSLSGKSIDALAGLTGHVSIHGLLKDSDRRREGYWEMLQLYRRASDQISVEIFDPNARPGALQDLGLAAVDRNAIKDGLSVAVAGSRKTIFRGVAEEDVTNAILEAGGGAPRVVGFLRGYGERDPASTAHAGLSAAREALRQEYYEVEDVRLDAPVPERITMLVAAGLQARIPQAELDRLKTWLDAGGRLLVLHDPAYDSGLGEVTARWGLRTKAVQVVDRRNNLRGQPEIPLVTDFTKHPIVRGFGAGLPLALPLPGAVEDFEPGDPAVYHEPVASSSPFAEGLTAAGTREQGPFALAAASYKTVGAKETRVVLVGDAAFATNGFLPESSNRNFFLNCAGWLCRSRAFVSIRPAPLAGQVLSLRRSTFTLFQAIAVGPPLLVVLAGVIVFYRRRGL